MTGTVLGGAAARGGAITFAGQIVRFGVQIASTVVLARLLTPADVGTFAMVFALLGVASVLGDFGLSLAAIQARSISHAQRSNLFWTNAAIGSLVMVAVLILAPYLTVLYDTPGITLLAQWLSASFLINSIAAQFRAEATRQLRFKWLAAADIVAVGVGLIAAIAVALSNGGYWALVVQQLAISATSLMMLVVAANWLPSFPRRAAGMTQLYRFGANTLGVQLLNYLTANVDSVLIGRYWGASQLGFYDRAYQIFKLPLQQIGAPMSRVAIPVLSRLQDDDAQYERFVLRAQVILSYTFAGAFIFLATAAGPLIDIILGPKWEPAKEIFAVLAIGGVFQGISYLYYWIFVSRSLTAIQFRWTVISRVFMVGAMAVGLQWGPTGVAAGGTMGLAVNWLILTAFPLRHARVSRAAILKISIRPIIVWTPVALVCTILTKTALGPLGATEALLITIALFGINAAIACVIPRVRQDFREIWRVVTLMKKS
ncbi:lipopolysaccharide biosynthesis protein [Microbacterium aureliae]